MKGEVLRILGLLSFLAGVLFFLEINITGFVVAGDMQNLPSFIGLILILVGIVIVFIARQEVSELEQMTVMPINPKKKLGHLTPKERAFRRKLINLFDMQKDVDPKKIAYLLPQYEKVKKTEEYVGGYDYPVFLGRKDGREEYFSVDTKEMVRVRIGDKFFPLPTHIDIQRRVDTNRYQKIGKKRIPWGTLLRYSGDIANYFKRRKK